ncbi:T9SS type A sorting domain-containing protein [Flavobacterium sp. J27]|uniref:LamG-like jellyroll fold domain-containing protein n=1 Tax=Flavobacterium sp. J27 TaxID=2060419 RepID=UPI0010317529|nr:T9SS type A sorting domain-containing protein [Flavobacterium sp. J27]
MRTILLFTSFLLTNFMCAQYPTSGLVAQYEFENGNVLADGANGTDFTQTGTALSEINDRFDVPPTSAVNLNGDYLTRPDINFPAVGSLGEYITLSFWLKTTTNDSNTRIILDDSNRPDFSTSTWAGYYVYLQDGKVGATLGVQYSGAFSYKSGGLLASKFVSDGNWHHVAILLSRSDNFSGCCTYTLINNLAIYIDGVSYGSGGNSQSTSSGSLSLLQTHDTTGNITVANNRYNSLINTNRYLDVIDDILIYNRILTPTEIASIANYNGFCFAPQSSVLTASAITETTATITISNGGTFNLAYHKTSEPFANAIIINGVTSSSVNLTNLDVFTDYEVYLSEQCTNNTTGWSLPITFKTERVLGFIYVNANATGNNNGISWTNAYTNLNDALADAQNDEEIWIAEGIYTPDASDRNATFSIIASNLKLYGGFVGNETQLSDRVVGSNETILSGDLLGNDDAAISFVNSTRSDNSYTVVSLIGENPLLDGLTITAGHANATSGATETRYGGGINKNASIRNVTLNNCKLTKNIATEASGAIAGGYNVFGGTGSMVISNCELSENLSAIGAAIYSANLSTAVITYSISNTLFSKNKATNTSSATNGYAGSSMWLRSYGSGSNIVTTISNCTFVDNVDDGANASMNNQNRVTLALTKNTNSNHTATLSNCLFWNNKAISGATARPIGGFIESGISTATILNSTDETNFTGITLSGTSANNNSLDPLFTDLAGGDYTLSLGSPAIDSGDNASVIGTTDLLGNQRVFNAVVDRGVYEFGSSVLSSTSFQEFTNFQIYPNPATSILHVSSSQNINVLEVYTLEGKLVLQTKANEVDVTSLQNGLYLIKVTTFENEFGVKKFVKQ